MGQDTLTTLQTWFFLPFPYVTNTDAKFSVFASFEVRPQILDPPRSVRFPLLSALCLRHIHLTRLSRDTKISTAEDEI